MRQVIKTCLKNDICYMVICQVLKYHAQGNPHDSEKGDGDSIRVLPTCQGEQLRWLFKLGAVLHICNPSYSGG